MSFSDFETIWLLKQILVDLNIEKHLKEHKKIEKECFFCGRNPEITNWWRNHNKA